MCTVIPQKKVWRVSFFVLLELLKYLPSRLFLLLCSPRLILFSAFWAVIWVEPILFVSVTVSFLSLKVLKLYNQCPERSGISTICSKSVFRKAISKHSKNVSNFSSCYSKPCFVFLLFWWRDKYQRNEKFNCFFQ